MIDEWGKGAKYWDKAWNPIIGCQQVSEGCEHCYAARLAAQYPELRDADGGFAPHQPKKEKFPPNSGVVFVGNMTDLFGEWNSDTKIITWSALLKNHSKITKLILTKRPNRLWRLDDVFMRDDQTWIGVTGENQERLEQRFDDFLRIQTPHRWLSLEPLLGEILLTDAVMNVVGECDFFDSLRKWFQWVVVGAESGPNRRPCNLAWVREIVMECRACGVPVFVKQLDIDGRLVKDINQFPADLQIRQIPWK